MNLCVVIEEVNQSRRNWETHSASFITRFCQVFWWHKSTSAPRNSKKYESIGGNLKPKSDVRIVWLNYINVWPSTQQVTDLRNNDQLPITSLSSLKLLNCNAQKLLFSFVSSLRGAQKVSPWAILTTRQRSPTFQPWPVPCCLEQSCSQQLQWPFEPICRGNTNNFSTRHHIQSLRH